MEPRKTPKPKLTAEAAYENSHLVARDYNCKERNLRFGKRFSVS